MKFVSFIFVFFITLNSQLLYGQSNPLIGVWDSFSAKNTKTGHSIPRFKEYLDLIFFYPDSQRFCSYGDCEDRYATYHKISNEKWEVCIGEHRVAPDDKICHFTNVFTIKNNILEYLNPSTDTIYLLRRTNKKH
jgi:hypothetical protein